MRIKWCYIVHESEVKLYYARLERTFTLLDEFAPHCLMTPELAKDVMSTMKDDRYKLKTVYLRAS